MDPEKTFSDFKLAISEDRKLDAAQHATDLIEWLARGGFRPAGAPAELESWLAAWAAGFDCEAL